MLHGEDTIVAIATAIVPEEGSIGIVRMSGKEAVRIARTLFDAPRQGWESHRVLYGHVRDPRERETIDEALLLLMLAPRSFTREDVVEFHCHGGIVPVQQVLRLCIENGARLANPGEFTLRAFLNGRIDLTRAESVADLVGARSRQAARVALAGLQGKLAGPIRQLRATCLDLLADIEARIDFEEDLPPLDEEKIVLTINEVSCQVQTILATAERGELLRSGLKVAIVGRPNVGKSSLLNAWSRSDRAIVTDLPGTTRDVVESQLVVGGIPVRVLDTAGIRDPGDEVERIGVERSRKVAREADLVLFTVSAAEGWETADDEIYRQVAGRPLILVINKVDIAAPDRVAYPKEIARVVRLSAARDLGIDTLEKAILESARADGTSASNGELAVNQRQAAALARAKLALARVRETIERGLPPDFWSIDLRSALQALGEITGEEVTESVLDRIFSRFCIGK